MNRRTAILLAALVVLGGIYLWTERPAGLGGSPAGSRVARARPGSASPGQAVLRLASSELDWEGGEFAIGRNPFGYGAAPRPDPKPNSPPPRPRREPTPQRQQETPPAQPPKPQPPPVDVIYLGNFGRPGHRIAVFSDAEGVYNAQVGDVVKEKFQLVHIGYESADLAFVGFPDAPPQRLAAGLR